MIKKYCSRSTTMMYHCKLVGIVLFMISSIYRSNGIGAQQGQDQQDLVHVPILIEHYDFKEFCNNRNRDHSYSNITFDVNDHLIVDSKSSKTNTTTTPTLIGPLISNGNANMFQCTTNGSGIFPSISHNIDGMKNRLESSNRTLLDLYMYLVQPPISSSAYNNDTTNVISWSIGLWIEPNDITYSGRRVILSMSTNTKNLNQNEDKDDIAFCHDGIIVQIVQFYSHIVVNYMNIYDECVTYHIKKVELISHMLAHIVVAIDERIQIYINGESMIRQSSDSTPTTHVESYPTTTNRVKYWSTATLQLFSNYEYNDQVFLGSIYQVDVFAAALSHYQVSTLYDHGIGLYYFDTGTNGTTTTSNDTKGGIIDATNSTSSSNTTNGQGDLDPFYYLNDPSNDSEQYREQLLLAKTSTTTTDDAQLIEGMVIRFQNDNSPNIIQLHSYNQSTKHRQLGIQITSIPSHGVLMYDGTEMSGLNDDYKTAENEQENFHRVVQINDVFLLFGNATSISIGYAGDVSSDYYNFPSYNIRYGTSLNVPQESFQYRIIEIPKRKVQLPLYLLANDVRSILSVSAYVEIPIYVLQVNRLHTNIEIMAPTPMSFYDNNSAIVVALNEYQFMIGKDIINIFGDNVDYVRVDVETSRDGTIAMHPDRVEVFSDTTHCPQRYYSNWACTTIDRNVYSLFSVVSTGPPSARSIVTFVALPNDIPDVLDHMIYTAYEPNFDGNITIRIFSGMDDNDCLHPKEHAAYYNITNFQSIFPDPTIQTIVLDHMLRRKVNCSKVEITIHLSKYIVVDEHEDGKQSSTKEFVIFGFSWNELIFGMLVVSAFVLCYFGRCKRILLIFVGIRRFRVRD